MLDGGGTATTVWCVAPMSVWSAAWLWSNTLHPVGPEVERVYIATAIGWTAVNELGMSAAEVIPGPGALSSVSLWSVFNACFEPPTAALLRLINDDETGCEPRLQETGWIAWAKEWERIRMGDITSEQVMADPALRARVEAESVVTGRLLTGAAAAFKAAIPPDPSLATLGRYAARLDAYLHDHPPLTDDARYREALSMAGWTDGCRPADLDSDPGPWCRVGFADDRPGETWCSWLVQRGLADSCVPGDPFQGVSITLPRERADALRDVGARLVRMVSCLPADRPHQT